MTLYKATAQGRVPMDTAEADALTAEWAQNDNLAVHKAKIKRRVTEKRLEVEAQGITVNSIPVNTTEYGQARLNRMSEYCRRKPLVDIEFKGADGIFRTINAVQAGDIFDAAGDHIQACYAAEKAHYDAIDALNTKAEVLAYDYSGGWPV